MRGPVQARKQTFESCVWGLVIALSNKIVCANGKLQGILKCELHLTLKDLNLILFYFNLF